MAQKKYVTKLLDRLIFLDKETTSAYYEMGQILSSFEHGDLYEVVGYESMKHMIEEELSYTPATARSYINLYRDFQRLHYNKTEAITLMQKFGYTNMSKVLAHTNSKLGVRAVKNRIDNLGEHQINFTLTDEELDIAHKALVAMGATKTKTGRWMHASDAFMEMVYQVINSKKAA